LVPNYTFARNALTAIEVAILKTKGWRKFQWGKEARKYHAMAPISRGVHNIRRCLAIADGLMTSCVIVMARLTKIDGAKSLVHLGTDKEMCPCMSEIVDYGAGIGIFYIFPKGITYGTNNRKKGYEGVWGKWHTEE
jgi:hypothetical protein